MQILRFTDTLRQLKNFINIVFKINNNYYKGDCHNGFNLIIPNN